MGEMSGSRDEGLATVLRVCILRIQSLRSASNWSACGRLVYVNGRLN